MLTSVGVVLQAGTQLLLFSYGSGLASSLFSIRVPDTDAARDALKRIWQVTEITARLSKRRVETPEQFNKVPHHE